MAREMARTLQGMFDITVNIENRVGGSGAVATAFLVTRAPPDGSVLQIVTPTQLITPLRARGIPTFREVTTVARLLLDPTILYVRRESPFANMDQMLDFARQNPGRLTWGIGSAGSLEQLLVEEVQQAADIQVRTVPHEGGGDAMVSVLGGHIDAGLGEPAQFLSQLETGSLRILTIFDDERSDNFPEVPTFQELGYSVQSLKFRGVWGPPGMPPELVELIGVTLAEAMENEPFHSYFRAGSMRPAVLLGDDFSRFLEEANRTIRASMPGSN